MDNTWLGELNNFLGISPNGKDTYELVEGAVVGVLGKPDKKLPEQDLLTAMKERLIDDMENEDRVMQTFLGVEGCHLNFLPADREVFTTTKKSYETKM